MFRKIVFSFILGLLVAVLAACSVPVSLAEPTSETTAVSPAIFLPTVTEASEAPVTTAVTYPIVDTGQTTCYDALGTAVACPTAGTAAYGQDAQYSSRAPSYTANGDGTVTDNVTGLMWQQSPDTNGDGAINAADKMTYDQAVAEASTFSLAGYSDWRLPTIKELYSLIQFTGVDPSGYNGTDTSSLSPFIDTDYFDFAYGDTSAGERLIDAQFASSTLYVSTTMGGMETLFGVNFADGRIKGYGLGFPGGPEKSFYVLYVRGNTEYGQNDWVDNGDGTISDTATGLMWQQADSGSGMVWTDALAYCENLDLAGANDWRLPNAKELQSLVDYGRSPNTTNSAAIDPLFSATQITNEAGQPDYAAYWSSTTHTNMMNGANAAYVNFGRSMGYMNGAWMDVHGAGAQRSDPKIGDPADWPTGHGPQGDAIRIYNYVRCVRGDVSEEVVTGGVVAPPTTGAAQLPAALEQPAAPEQPAAIGQPPDLAAAAAKLGITEAALRTALGPPPPDFAAAAQQLGISEAALIEALGVPGGPSALP